MRATEFLFFGDDWGRHPSSSQHLTRRLLNQHHVTWINTIGMRPPRFDWLTLKRGFGKIQNWCRQVGVDAAVTDQSTNLEVIDTKMWPWMTRAWDRWLNCKLLSMQLREKSKGKIAITTIPIVADLVDYLEADRWIYYCVDDYSAWPGLDSHVHQEMEDQLIQKVGRVIAVSDHLVESVARRGKSADLLTHGVDLDFWQCNSGGANPLHSHLEKTEPIALFWGVIDQRMNADWVVSLADSLKSGKIVLAGPTQNPDARLLSHSKIQLTGPVSFGALPGLATSASVLIMPYRDLPVTRAMQPLKLKEYLATLRPVVTSDLPSVQTWKDCLDMTMTQEAFVSTVSQFMNSSKLAESVYKDRIIERLARESWDSKASQFLHMLTS